MATTYSIRTETRTIRNSLRQGDFKESTAYTVVDQDGESWGGTGDLKTAEERRDYLQRCADLMAAQDAK
jgi:hypothetical protein